MVCGLCINNLYFIYIYNTYTIHNTIHILYIIQYIYKMNKKLQFQIQTIQSKLIQYNNNIENLKQSKSNLQNKLISSNETTETTESTESIENNNNNILELKQKSIDIEIQHKILKQNISKLKTEIQNNTYKLNNLDDIYNTKLIDEETIYKEELFRIEEQNIIIKHNQTKLIETALNDKIQLNYDIEVLTNEMQLQNNIITQLQIISHSSRKNILQDLHDQKQQKQSNQQQINNIKENEFEYDNNLKLLEDKQTQLIEFKKLLIDREYNVDYNNIELHQLITYYNENKEYNINIDLSFNDKIVKIDNMININQTKINSMNKQNGKNKQINNIKIKNIIDKYNIKDRIKVIGYKDQFKIEKQKRDLLENILKDICLKYDTYDDIIIKNINDNIESEFDNLLTDKIRANDRFNITKMRISEDYNNNKLILNNLIIDNNLNLAKYSKELNTLTIELDNIKTLIENLNSVDNDINKIDIEIDKYQLMIYQMQKDIDNIQNSIVV